MARHGLTPGQWRELDRSERIEMMAYEQAREEERAELLAEIQKNVPGEWGALAQVIVLAAD